MQHYEPKQQLECQTMAEKFEPDKTDRVRYHLYRDVLESLHQLAAEASAQLATEPCDELVEQFCLPLDLLRGHYQDVFESPQWCDLESIYRAIDPIARSEELMTDAALICSQEWRQIREQARGLIEKNRWHVVPSLDDWFYDRMGR